METNDEYQKELFVLDSNTWNHLTVNEQMSSGSFKNCYLQIFVYKSYITNVYVQTGLGITRVDMLKKPN